MFMEYLHLMMDINLMDRLMSQNPGDLELSSRYVQNITRSRNLWIDLFDVMRNAGMSTRLLDYDGFKSLNDYLQVLNVKIGQN